MGNTSPSFTHGKRFSHHLLLFWFPQLQSWRKHRSWKGQTKIIQFNPPEVNKDTYSKIRVLRVQSSLTLNVSRHEASSTSLGTLSQCLTNTTANNYFLTSNLNLLSSSLKSFPPILSQQILLRHLSPSFLYLPFT